MSARGPGAMAALGLSAALHVSLVLAWGTWGKASPGIAPPEPSGLLFVHVQPRPREGPVPAAPPRAVRREPPPSVHAAAPRLPAPVPVVPVRSQAPAVRVALAAAQDAPPPSALDAGGVAVPAPQAVAAPEPQAVAPAPPPSLEVPAYRVAPAPEYPQAARDDELEGVVLLRVLVSRDGRAAQVLVARSSGHRALDSAAVAGVRAWTFRPARRGGEEIEAWMEVPVRFQLR